MESSAEEHKKKGNEAFKNADWDLAIKEYNKAISLDNKQPAYFSNRAACWSSKGNHESALADASRCLELDPVRYSARSVGSLQRGFEQVQGLWSSFLELREGEHSLVFLHRTASSAEAEFAKVFPAVQKVLGSPLSVFAPDRPCHGYSPCGGAAGDVKWLQGLLKSRQAQHMAYVASGKEAAHTILNLLRERQEAAQVLLISPGVAADRPSLADFQQWLKRQRQSPRALADAVRWAASVLESETQDEDTEIGAGSPEGCSITILTEAGETEDKVFLEELEGQGHVVRSRQLSPEESLHEEVAKEASQLLA